MFTRIAKLTTNLLVVFSIVAESSSFGSDPTISSGTRVAVIDMARVLREHASLKLRLMKLDVERKEHEASVEQQRCDLVSQIAELDDLDVDLPEYRRQHQEIEAARSELEASHDRKQQEFAERSARLHYDAYREICDQVKNFAERNKIDLVLNYDSADVEPTDAADVVREFQGKVVYQQRLDISDVIINAGNVVVYPRPVKRYPFGTSVKYAPCAPSTSRESREYILSRKAADRVVSIANRIESHSGPGLYAPSTCAPVGSFSFGDSSLYLLRVGRLEDMSHQGASDPVLKKLVEIQQENDWKMDDQVFRAWIRELEKASDTEE